MYLASLKRLPFLWPKSCSCVNDYRAMLMVRLKKSGIFMACDYHKLNQDI